MINIYTQGTIHENCFSFKYIAELKKKMLVDLSLQKRRFLRCVTAKGGNITLQIQQKVI